MKSQTILADEAYEAVTSETQTDRGSAIAAVLARAKCSVRPLSHRPRPVARLLLAGALLVLGAVALLFLLPDPAFAGELRQIGKRTNAEITGMAGYILGAVIAVVFCILAARRNAPGMVVCAVLFCIAAFMVFNNTEAGQTLKNVGSDLLSGGDSTKGDGVVR